MGTQSDRGRSLSAEARRHLDRAYRCEESDEFDAALAEWAVLPQASGKVTLEVQVHYCDRQGQPLKEKGRWFVDVRSEANSGRFTPQEVYVQGDYVAGEKVTGDYIAEGGQKGDRIDIRRGAVGPRVSLGEGAELKCRHCGAPQPVGAAFCEQCGKRLEEKE